MTNQPTSNREEALGWVSAARPIYDDLEDTNLLLVAVIHALLDIADAVRETRSIEPTQAHDATPKFQASAEQVF